MKPSKSNNKIFEYLPITRIFYKYIYFSPDKYLVNLKCTTFVNTVQLIIFMLITLLRLVRVDGSVLWAINDNCNSTVTKRKILDFER